MTLKRFGSLAIGIATVVSAAPAAAQDTVMAPNLGDAPEGIADIIVTARRTAENLQTTPVAVTAASGEMLQRAQISNASQLQNIVPGLVVQPAVAQPGSAAFALRGQGSPDGLIAIDQAIGSYFDGVYIARSSGSLFNFVDVERVEVLRGPQGTLYGRNTTGGAINVIANKPSGDFEGMARLRAGNYNFFEGTAILNLPLHGDELAFRGVYQHSQRKGFGVNASFNERVGGDNVEFLRGSLRVAPQEWPVEILIQADFTDRRTGGELVGLRSFSPTGTNAFLVGACSGPGARALCPVVRPAGDTLANYAISNVGTDDFYRVFLSTSGIYGDAKTKGLSGTVEWKLGDAATIKSITAWRGLDQNSLSDNDGSPYFFTGGLLRGHGNAVQQSQFSQELQLAGSAFDDRVKYIFGGFYFTEEGLDRGRNYSVYPISTQLSYVDASVTNKSYAGFGQITVSLTDTIRATGGLRYTKDKRFLVRRNRSENTVTGVFTCNITSGVDPVGFLLPNGQVCQATNKGNFDYMSYTAGLDWEATDDVFVYAKTSRGYRSGGFNTRAIDTGPSVGFDPERVTDYEVGAKLDLLDRRLRVNTAAFYTDYNNVQRSVPVVASGTLTSGIQNAATAVVKGFELEVIAKPVDALTLSGSLTLLDAKYNQFNILASDRVTILDVSKSPYPFTPKRAYTISADYELPIVGAGDLTFHVDYAFRSSTYSTGPTVLPDGTVVVSTGGPAVVPRDTNRIPGYGIVNGQITFELDDPQLEFGVFARNITKKKYILRLLALEDTALGVTSYLPGDPRTFGAVVSYRF